MVSLKFQFSQMGFCEDLKVPKTQLNSTVKISCGLRKGPREPMWRTRVLSTEAIHAVQSLKLAKSTDRLDQVFNNRLSRLLKADLLGTLNELRRQNQVDLAFKVFNYVRKEVWYEPDISLFNGMILMFGKNKMIEVAEQLLSELKEEGLEPDTRTYSEMIGAYFKVDMVEKAMATYELMKATECLPDKLTLTIMIRNLENAGEEKLAAEVKKECTEYLDSPEKFFEEVERTYPKRRSLKLV